MMSLLQPALLQCQINHGQRKMPIFLPALHKIAPLFWLILAVTWEIMIPWRLVRISSQELVTTMLRIKILNLCGVLTMIVLPKILPPLIQPETSVTDIHPYILDQTTSRA